MFQPELHGLEALFPLRREAAEVAKPLVEVRDALAQVHLVERETSQLGARREPGVAGLQLQLVPGPGESVGENLRDQPQPLHQHVWPVTLRLHCIQAQNPDCGSPASESGRVRFDLIP